MSYASVSSDKIKLSVYGLNLGHSLFLWGLSLVTKAGHSLLKRPLGNTSPLGRDIN